jgi:hypothetical protein
MPFTQSFRAGQELGALLSEAWNKPVVGVNPAQTIQYVSYNEALDFMRAKNPGDLLCLGRRNGQMAEALNHLERDHGEVFNKETVYASIRDGDTWVTYDDDTAVFTTFDSSKGLERPASVVFDYDEAMWDMRCGFPNVDTTVMRNVFLVAASRGKHEVVSVRSEQAHRQPKASASSPCSGSRNCWPTNNPSMTNRCWHRTASTSPTRRTSRHVSTCSTGDALTTARARRSASTASTG